MPTGIQSPADHSGTITAGGAAQDIAAANRDRQWLLIQNVSDTDLWIEFGGDAVEGLPSILLKAHGGSYENPPHFCPTGRISILGATAGKPFTCKDA